MTKEQLLEWLKAELKDAVLDEKITGTNGKHSDLEQNIYFTGKAETLASVIEKVKELS